MDGYMVGWMDGWMAGRNAKEKQGERYMVIAERV